MATNFEAKSAKFAYPTYIHRTGVLERIGSAKPMQKKIKWQ